MYDYKCRIRTKERMETRLEKQATPRTLLTLRGRGCKIPSQPPSVNENLIINDE